jgi:hypothetical protein
MDLKETNRGFSIAEFEDYYGHKCSLQRSSLIEPDCIWFGMSEPDLQEHGWHPTYTARCRPWSLPENVHAFSRMHLTRDQVAELLPYLQRFVETGELYEQSEETAMGNEEG